MNRREQRNQSELAAICARGSLFSLLAPVNSLVAADWFVPFDASLTVFATAGLT
jgi:hypothetical protein